MYFGTNEAIAKSSPVKGLEGPVILCNTHPGAFCKSFKKWGIIKIDIDFLTKNKFKPLINKRKRNLQRILEEDGVCVYNGDIPVACIEKIMTYDSDSNPFMTNLLIEKSDEKLTDWLEGKRIMAEDVVKSNNCKYLMEVDIHIANRIGLDLYYIRDRKLERQQEQD